MKKILTIALALLLLVTFAVPAFAAETAQMTVSPSQSSAKPGETVTFTVKISTVDDCRSAGIVISYDASVFEYVSGSCLASGAAMSDFSGGTGVLAFSEGVTLSGNLFQFALKVKSTAAAGSYRVSGTPSVRTGSGSIACGIGSATVSITCDHTYGIWSESGSGHSRACSKCGHTDSASHAWDSGTVIKAATCAQEGTKRVTCTVCGATAAQTISKTGSHTWGGWKKVDGSTHKQTCTVCGKQNTANHTWDAGKTTVKATCQAPGEIRYTCTVCGATTAQTISKTGSHTWGGWKKVDGSTHKQACTVCGKQNTANHTWDAGKATAKATCQSPGEIRYTCTVCGASKTETVPATGKHTYDHGCDGSCNACGAVRQTSHAYGKSWSAGESGHFHRCTVCGEQDGVAAHEFENDCAAACLTCGYLRDTAHVYGDWHSDENSHWQECALCGEISEMQPHISGGEATEKTDQVCTVCGRVLTPALGHSFGEDWQSDEENHWQECACGEKSGEAAHTWDRGRENGSRSVTYTCTVCAAQRTEDAPRLSPVVIALAAALAGTIGYFLLRKKR